VLRFLIRSLVDVSVCQRLKVRYPSKQNWKSKKNQRKSGTPSVSNKSTSRVTFVIFKKKLTNFLENNIYIHMENKCTMKTLFHVSNYINLCYKYWCSEVSQTYNNFLIYLEMGHAYVLWIMRLDSSHTLSRWPRE